MLHEQPRQQRHAERLDQPVDEQRHREALGLRAMPPSAVKSTLSIIDKSSAR